MLSGLEMKAILRHSRFKIISNVEQGMSNGEVKFRVFPGKTVLIEY